MTDAERDAILAIALHAAFADGSKDERERAQVKRIAESLSQGGGANLPALYQDVLLGRRTLEAAAAALGSPGLRQLAYEMAVCVCDADGEHGEKERAFLASLQRALGLEAAAAAAFASEAASIARAGAEPPPPASTPKAVTLPAGEEAAALDQAILNAAVLNGALELLPESLATMAILPLQMRLVYRVGRAYGYELDAGHVKDFAATLGVGLTGQYLEGIGRKLLGGVLGAIAGRAAGGLAKQAASSAVAFATTWALGHVAVEYYAGGRTMDAARLQRVFRTLLADAQGLRQRYAGEIESRARTLDAKQLVSLVKNG
jgi:uncharacterized protein (DUF697 family)/tellurite resistance protein